MFMLPIRDDVLGGILCFHDHSAAACFELAYYLETTIFIFQIFTYLQVDGPVGS